MKKKFGLKVLLGSILFLFIASMVFAVGRCVPCKLNHYCIDGLRYQCPANAPVTQGTGAGALNECLTCTQRNGNSANPIYDDLVGDCVSCYEYDSSTPYWDGNACVACASGTTFNGETGLCESSITCNANNFCTLTKAINTCETGYIAIDTAEKLAKIGTDSNYPLSGNYCLINDISLSAYSSGWTPIGAFEGIFDGNNKTISDLTIVISSAGGNFGFFESISSSAHIRNLALTNANVNIEGTNVTIAGNWAILVGSNGGSINNVGVSGVLSCSSLATSRCAMIAGYSDGSISNSYASGNITVDTNALSKTGGLVGYNENGTVNKCYAAVHISGQTSTGMGGLIGESSGGSISNSYAVGSVQNSTNFVAGGLVAKNNSTLNNCYSVSSVLATDGSAAAGAFCGITGDDYYISAFYNADISNFTACGSAYNTYCSDIQALTTAEMQTPQTFIDAGWDTSIWELVQGQYPKLIGVGGQN